MKPQYKKLCQENLRHFHFELFWNVDLLKRKQFSPQEMFYLNLVIWIYCDSILPSLVIQKSPDSNILSNNSATCVTFLQLSFVFHKT